MTNPTSADQSSQILTNPDKFWPILTCPDQHILFFLKLQLSSKLVVVSSHTYHFAVHIIFKKHFWFAVSAIHSWSKFCQKSTFRYVMMFYFLFVTVSRKKNQFKSLLNSAALIIFTILEKQKMAGISLVITLSFLYNYLPWLVLQ